jgi:tripartite-type tricarboxylate transporter receptor subunit TctC
LAGELFKAQAGIEMLHVPYKGSPQAITDVIGGQVPLMFSNLPTVMTHIQSGKLKAIGITDSARTASAPQIPTLQEQGVSGVVVTSWYGLLAPKGMPAALANQLARDVADILNKPATVEQLKAQALTVWLQTPAEFGAHIKAETASWARIIKAKNISLE